MSLLDANLGRLPEEQGSGDDREGHKEAGGDDGRGT